MDVMTEFITKEPRRISMYEEIFTEGEWGHFYIVKSLHIPGDDEYYVMESKAGNRILIPTVYYRDYNLLPGTVVKCRIDKINCSGRIFLEPEHPFYKPGKEYNFVLKNKNDRLGGKYRIKREYVLMGTWKDEIFATLMADDQLPLFSIIRAEVVRTRKGVLILSNIRVINNC